MKSTKLVLCSVISLLPLIAIISCNESGIKSQKAEAIAPTISKENIELYSSLLLSDPPSPRATWVVLRFPLNLLIY